jgi:hypothetical protein
MKITRSLTAAALVSTTALAVLGFRAESASAKGPEVRTSGSCSASTDWKLKTKTEDNRRLEVELEIDSNRNGQKWYLSISDNGKRVYTSSRHTHVPSGSFEVERNIANRSGTDRITAVARNKATGEVCRGALTFRH